MEYEGLDLNDDAFLSTKDLYGLGKSLSSVGDMDHDQDLDDEDDDPTLDASAREARKRERLREIARNSRKRKRERIEALQSEVTKLRETNRQLELKLKMAQNKLGEATSGRGNRGKDEEMRRQSEVRSMGKMLEHNCTDEEILHRLQTYSETYSDFGEERQKLVKVHINQLEQLLLPTQISKMLLWVLKQDDEFYEDTSPGSIWNMLCSELALDEEQKKALMQQRYQLGKQNTSMKKCLVSLNNFEQEVQRNMVVRREQMSQVMSIISPTQTIKFLQWVENNQACVHMLNGLWKVNKQRNQEVIKEIMKEVDEQEGEKNTSTSTSSSEIQDANREDSEPQRKAAKIAV